MGISTLAELLRRADFRGRRPRQGVRRPLLHLDGVADRRRRPRRRRGGGAEAARAGVPGPVRRRSRISSGAASISGAATANITCSTRTRSSSCSTRRAAASTASSRNTRSSSTTRAASAPRCAGCSSSRPRPQPIPIDEVEPVDAHRQALRDRRDVVRVDQPGSARDAGDRDEPPRRQIEHRRGRRGSGARRARRQRRLAPQRGPPGRVGAIRRHQRVPGQLHRSADQDGAGRQARRRRSAARRQGLSVDREGAPRDAGRRPDLAAAASRHLLDRGSGAADLRPEEREPEGAHPREAGRARPASARSPPAWRRRTPTSC